MHFYTLVVDILVNQKVGSRLTDAHFFGNDPTGFIFCVKFDDGTLFKFFKIKTFFIEFFDIFFLIQILEKQTFMDNDLVRENTHPFDRIF